MEGKVKWFSPAKGYGFIEVEGSTDVFVHQSAILMDGFRMLQEGQTVYFSVKSTDKGHEAFDVQIV